MEFLIVLAIVLVVAAVLSAPLRREWDRRDRGSVDDLHADREVSELEAARDAKYREIRDAELDHRTGKLSDGDFHSLDGTLRAEAVEILRALDRATDRPPATIGER